MGISQRPHLPSRLIATTPQTEAMKVLLVLALAASAIAAPLTVLSGQPLVYSAPETIPFKGTTTFKDVGANQLLATNVQTPTVYSGASPLVYSGFSSPLISGIPSFSGISSISGISGISGYIPTTYTGFTGIKTNAIIPKVAAATAGSSHIVY